MCSKLIVFWAGNVVSFAGGVILALETLARERERRRIYKIQEMFKSPSLAKLRYEVNGIVISDERDLEIAHLRLSSKRAALGLSLLVIGFALTIVSEFLDGC
jgi:hypothetical protein